jgi:serine/threonine protein kinase/tetratricopeptide (TPR) repeat protein
VRTESISAPSSADGRPPPHIPDHQLLRRIGGGSYGEVWLARNTFGTLRAVKIVYRQAFEDQRPFEREFRGIRRFEPISRSHEGLVDILQVGSAEDYFYYVMELADRAEVSNQRSEIRGQKPEVRHEAALTSEPPAPGSDLDSYVPRTLRADLQARGRLPPSECAALGLNLARALAHLHQHGLVHRDVKPANIIFAGGEPKLADIGLVADLSDARSFVGTEGFIPPEGPGTPQADLYSLGKLLYEAVTGLDRRDFPRLPDELSEDEQLLELNAVIVKACKTEPAQRYRNTEEMEADLELLRLGKSVKQRRARQRRLGWFTKAVLAACAVSAMLIVIPALARKLSQPSTPVAQAIFMGVFPFRATGTNAQHHELCERIADGLTGALGQVPGLRLAPRQWAYSLTDQEPDPMRFAAALGLDEFVAIRLSNAGGEQRLEVTLVHAAGGQEHWAETLPTNRADLVAVQLRIVESLAASLGVILDQDDRQRVQERLDNALGAYELVQLARRSWGHRPEAFTTQIDLYSQAIARDPHYVAAHLELAYVYRNMSDNLRPAREAMPEMQNYVQRALALDSTHPSVYHHLAVYQMCYEWNWDEAQTLFQRQKEITGRWDRSYAGWLESQARFDEAQQILELNIAEEPDTSYNWGFGNHFLLRRDFNRALTETLKIAQTYPDSCDVLLARCYEELGRYAEALVTIKNVRAHNDGPGQVAIEGHILARMGRQAEARERLEEVSRMSRYRYVPPVFPAILNVALDDRDAAFAWLEKAYTDRSECMTFSQSFGLGVDPYWDPLRNDPHFVDLLRRVGLAREARLVAAAGTTVSERLALECQTDSKVSRMLWSSAFRGGISFSTVSQTICRLMRK